MSQPEGWLNGSMVRIRTCYHVVGKANQANTWSHLGSIEETVPLSDAWAHNLTRSDTWRYLICGNKNLPASCVRTDFDGRPGSLFDVSEKRILDPLDPDTPPFSNMTINHSDMP